MRPPSIWRRGPPHLRNDPVKRSTLEASGLMTPLAIWHPTKSGGPHHCRVIPFSTTTPERCPFERFRSLVHSAGSYTTCPGRNHQPSTHSHSLEGTGQNDMRYFAGFKPEASRVERLTGSFWRCKAMLNKYGCVSSALSVQVLGHKMDNLLLFLAKSTKIPTNPSKAQLSPMWDSSDSPDETGWSQPPLWVTTHNWPPGSGIWVSSW